MFITVSSNEIYACTVVLFTYGITAYHIMKFVDCSQILNDTFLLLSALIYSMVVLQYSLEQGEVTPVTYVLVCFLTQTHSCIIIRESHIKSLAKMIQTFQMNYW